MSNIADYVVNLWQSGRKTKLTTGGWLSGNAVCCPHNGQTQDKRGRGGLISPGDGAVSWHCFNCGFKAHYSPGEQLSYKFRKLLTWMGASESEIHRLVFEALREKELLTRLGQVQEIKREEVKVKFKKFPLPAESVSFWAMIEFYELKSANNYPKEFMDAVTYASNRKVDFKKYDLYWSASTEGRMNKRVIIPFTYKNEIVGYTARAVDDTVKPKYMTEIDSGYVYNLDMQKPESQFILVMEGPLDAIALDGVAVLHGEISKQQIALLEAQNKEIIVVPDYEKSGSNLVKTAMEQGWSVAFPLWAEQEKDASAAVEKFGKLFVLKDIVDNVERMKLKIQLRWRAYGNN
jgi:hypothetical protein